MLSVVLLARVGVDFVAVAWMMVPIDADARL